MLIVIQATIWVEEEGEEHRSQHVQYQSKLRYSSVVKLIIKEELEEFLLAIVDKFLFEFSCLKSLFKSTEYNYSTSYNLQWY